MKPVWRQRPDGLVTDLDGYAQQRYRDILDSNRTELAWLQPLYDEAEARDYLIATALQQRINELRASIYWNERKLAME